MQIKLEFVLVTVGYQAIQSNRKQYIRGTEKIPNILILPFCVLFQLKADRVFISMPWGSMIEIATEMPNARHANT